MVESTKVIAAAVYDPDQGEDAAINCCSSCALKKMFNEEYELYAIFEYSDFDADDSMACEVCGESIVEPETEETDE